MVYILPFNDAIKSHKFSIWNDSLKSKIGVTSVTLFPYRILNINWGCVYPRETGRDDFPSVRPVSRPNPPLRTSLGSWFSTVGTDSQTTDQLLFLVQAAGVCTIGTILFSMCFIETRQKWSFFYPGLYLMYSSIYGKTLSSGIFTAGWLYQILDRSSL